MDIKHFLNYPSENDAMMESSTDKEIIQWIMDTPADGDHDLDNTCILPNVSLKRGVLSNCNLKFATR